MNLLLKVKDGFAYSVEQYDLNKSRNVTGVGVVLLYLLSTKLTGSSIIGMQEYTEKTKTVTVRDKSDLLKEFDSEKLEFWELKGKYQGNDIIIHGQYKKTIITVFYPKTSNLNVKTLLEEAEKEAM